MELFAVLILQMYAEEQGFASCTFAKVKDLNQERIAISSILRLVCGYFLKAYAPTCAFVVEHFVVDFLPVAGQGAAADAAVPE